MTPVIIIAMYLAIGAAVVAWSLRRGSEESRVRTVVLALLLWPYVLPFLMHGPAPTRGAESETHHRARILELEGRLEEALGRARGAVPGVDCDRVARMAGRLGRRLRRLDLRMAELERATAEAPQSVRSSLESLLASSEQELEGGLRLMEELAGKLTLLAFSDLGGPGSPGDEGDEVQDLLHRLEGMACATAEVASLGALTSPQHT